MKAFELGDENAYICHKEPDPDDINREGEVKVYRLNPDGTRGEMLRTMDAFPVGWNDPAQYRKTPGRGLAKKKGEGNMVENWKEITQKVQTLVDEGLSTYKASRAVSKEIGVHYTTIYNRVRKEIQASDPVPAQAANREPERESQEPAEVAIPLENGFTADDEPIPYVPGKYEVLGEVIGGMVDEKNQQYGDAFNQGGKILAILYPEGVRPDQYRDMLGVIRVIDKLFRIANGKQGDENPWQDIAGYGLLGVCV